MNEIEAIKKFIKHTTTENKSRRYCGLVESKKGRIKFLKELYHGFQGSIREGIKSQKHYKDNKLPCYAYCAGIEFGLPFETFADAYEKLSCEDGWIIVTQDATFGVYRPESEWDKEVAIRI
jgi:hypothetical protein